MMIDSEQQTLICAALRNSRREGLTGFLEEFLPLLQQEGFSLQDLIEAIANWMHRSSPPPNEVIRHLEDAVSQMSRAKRN